MRVYKFNYVIITSLVCQLVGFLYFATKHAIKRSVGVLHKVVVVDTASFAKGEQQ